VKRHNSTEHKIQKCLNSSLQLPQANVKLTQCEHTGMMILSPGIVYWVQALLHWCDNNAVFFVDVSRVYANSSSLRWQETKSKRTHTAFLKNFSVTRTKGKKCLSNRLPTIHFKRSPNSNIFVVKYQSFTKFSIRLSVSKYIL